VVEVLDLVDVPPEESCVFELEFVVVLPSTFGTTVVVVDVLGIVGVGVRGAVVVVLELLPSELTVLFVVELCANAAEAVAMPNAKATPEIRPNRPVTERNMVFPHCVISE
jgi:hypothetical protein